MTTTPSAPHASEALKLAPGDRFRVRSLRGSLYECTWICGEASWVVRLANGTLARLNPRRLNLSTFEALGASSRPFLHAGDEVLVRLAQGGRELRAEVVGLRAGALVLRTSEGRSMHVSPEALRSFALLFRAHSLCIGDHFRVHSRSGSLLSGQVLDALEDDRLRVTLSQGETVVVRSGRLDFDTLEVELKFPPRFVIRG